MSIIQPSWLSGRIHVVRHRSKWQYQQNLKYCQFIQENKQILNAQDRNKKHQIYNRMSDYVGTRSANQCRSHHQKVMKRFGSIQNFSQNFKRTNGRLIATLRKKSLRIEGLKQQKKLGKKIGFQNRCQNVINQEGFELGSSVNEEPNKGPFDSERFENSNLDQLCNCKKITAKAIDEQKFSQRKRKRSRKLNMHCRMNANSQSEEKQNKFLCGRFQVPSSSFCPQNYYAQHLQRLSMNPYFSWNQHLQQPNDFSQKGFAQNLIDHVELYSIGQPLAERLKIFQEVITFLKNKKYELQRMQSFQKISQPNNFFSGNFGDNMEIDKLCMATGDFEEERKQQKQNLENSGSSFCVSAKTNANNFSQIKSFAPVQSMNMIPQHPEEEFPLSGNSFYHQIPSQQAVFDYMKMMGEMMFFYDQQANRSNREGLGI